MKRTVIAVALLAAVPTVALAASKKGAAPGPGQSEYAPGQQTGPAKKSAPGQRSGPATEYAPGQQPRDTVKKKK
jgi:hypothetical protein